jgi:hypothetical protein
MSQLAARGGAANCPLKAGVRVALAYGVRLLIACGDRLDNLGCQERLWLIKS